MNAARFLYVPGRWQMLDPRQQEFTVFVVRVEGKWWSFHCQEVDLLGQQTTMQMVDLIVRLGLCAMFKLPDAQGNELKVTYVGP